MLVKLQFNSSSANYVDVYLVSSMSDLTHTANTGVAFGLGEGSNIFFLVLALLLVSGLLWLYQQSKAKALLQHIALALIIGGALGNVIDRIQHGHVVDFVNIVLPTMFSNVSNFADHAIVIGVPLMLLDGFLQERKEKMSLLNAADPSETEMTDLVRKAQIHVLP